mmetsp:Transcript_4995/g.15924  ORF Transcript_4995/g.15924 Transcript_4995/m.15924 type:complete len:311 (-) Transcript_4995:615-1547(-)
MGWMWSEPRRNRQANPKILSWTPERPRHVRVRARTGHLVARVQALTAHPLFEILDGRINDLRVKQPNHFKAAATDDVVGDAVIRRPHRDREVPGKEDVEAIVKASGDDGEDTRKGPGPHHKLDPVHRGIGARVVGMPHKGTQDDQQGVAGEDHIPARDLADWNHDLQAADDHLAKVGPQVLHARAAGGQIATRGDFAAARVRVRQRRDEDGEASEEHERGVDEEDPAQHHPAELVAKDEDQGADDGGGQEDIRDHVRFKLADLVPEKGHIIYKIPLGADEVVDEVRQGRDVAWVTVPGNAEAPGRGLERA